LILAEKHIPGLGVAAYALMAAGGDLGGSVGPQVLGAVVDTVSASAMAVKLGETLSLTPEQVGIKAGVLFAALFPILGTIVLILLIRYVKNMKREA